MTADHDPVARLRGRRIHVVGFSGTEGSAVVDFLLARGITTLVAHDLATREGFPEAYRRAHEWMSSAEQDEGMARLLGAPITLHFKDRYLEDIASADVIYAGQAWFRYPENEPLRRARDAGVPLGSMTALFFEAVPCPILGVTGTNGKFTVVHLAAAMLAGSGRRTFVSGNDRSHVPILYRLPEVAREAIVVLEISNRQLIGLPYSPHIAVVTNLAHHHLDDHGSFEAYVEAKRTILAHQRADDWAILNGDDPPTRALAARSAARVLFWSRTEDLVDGACIAGGRIVLRLQGREDVVCEAALAVPGAHMLENALGATLAARIAGASPEAIGKVLREFRGLPHRLSLIADVGGVRYYEDSLATNPSAAAAAIRAFDRPLVLLAGGHRRLAAPGDFRPMAEALALRQVRAAVLFGVMAPLLADAIAATCAAVPIVRCGTLEEAVRAASRLAQPGDVVSLSPGCESFDQFRDYRDRAEQFRALVSALAPKASGPAPQTAAEPARREGRRWT